MVNYSVGAGRRGGGSGGMTSAIVQGPVVCKTSHYRPDLATCSCVITNRVGTDSKG